MSLTSDRASPRKVATIAVVGASAAVVCHAEVVTALFHDEEQRRHRNNYSAIGGIGKIQRHRARLAVGIVCWVTRAEYISRAALLSTSNITQPVSV